MSWQPAVTQPEYRLSEGVRLDARENGMWLWSEAPLAGLRLNDSAYQLLRTVTAGANGAGPLEPAQRAFVLQLVDQGWLELSFPLLTGPFPSVTVVVPVHNRPRQIQACLRSLQELDYPREQLEIIVVDDASDRATVAAVEPFGVQLISLPIQQGAAACRNVGLQMAGGEIVAFTDSDCQVSPGWLKELIPYLALPNCVALGGRVLPESENTPFARYVAGQSALDMGVRSRRVRPHSAVFYVPTCNFLVWAGAARAIGGFDMRFPIGEDIDLEYRLRQSEGDIWYIADGAIYHDYRTRPQRHWRRQFVYALSEGYLQEEHPDLRKRWRVRKEFFILVAVLLLAALTRQPLLLLLILPLLGFHIARQWRQVRPLQAGISIRRFAVSSLRGYGEETFFASWLILRYYFLFLTLLVVAAPSLWWTLPLCAVIAGLGQFLRSQTKVAFPSFLAFYVMDSVVYHAGILSAVVGQRTLWPLRTRIEVR